MTAILTVVYLLVIVFACVSGVVVKRNVFRNYN